ncbi:MAG: hypothetical protein H6853_09060 [Rhodospirillales bacterium]|nr:hypothetical protein [Alphaproteobacteria bacterium]USO03650.1 MAG: hypothetical protein H6853_09060 [Rhodospirillales bacterium]
MIGPHEGKELELMLAGDKKLAFFHDIIPAEGEIAEEIIPERAFAPYVQEGRLLRFAGDIPKTGSADVLRFVCFTLPGEEWRAQFILWLKREWLGGRLEYNPAHEDIIGNLLGYDAQDIEEYLVNRS